MLKMPAVKVNKVIETDREMLSKDGVTKRKAHIVNILCFDDDGDPVKITAFDPQFEIPKKGSSWVPPMKSWACRDGMVQDVFCA